MTQTHPLPPTSPSSLSPPSSFPPHLPHPPSSSSSARPPTTPNTAVVGRTATADARTDEPMYDPDAVGDEPPVGRAEFVRLAVQALRDCGFTDAARTLERESGFELDLAPVDDLRAAVRGGRWEEAVGLLGAVGITGGPFDKARFLIEEQKYLELLETGQTKRALVALRAGLAPLALDPERVHRLSSYMLCVTREELLARSSWSGASGPSRTLLLTALEAFVPPALSPPPHRLHTLLSQARAFQTASGPYVVGPRRGQTLFRDAEGRREGFPLRAAEKRADPGVGELWNLAWSKDGRRLVTVGTGRKIVVYAVGDRPAPSAPRKITLEAVVDGAHDGDVSGVGWAPDGSALVTTAEDEIRLWNTATWTVKRTLAEHAERISAVRWLPTGTGFMTASEDGRLCHFNKEGDLLASFHDAHGLRIFDFDFSPDSARLIGAASWAREAVPLAGAGAAGSGGAGRSGAIGGGGEAGSGGYKEPCFRVFVMAVDGLEMVESHALPTPGEITGFRLSADGQAALVSLHPHELQLWSVPSPSAASTTATAPAAAVAAREPAFVRSLKGRYQSQYYVRACFAGPEDNLVISGSEDARVYVWHRRSGELLEVLAGHGPGTVNAVAWRPDVVDGGAGDGDGAGGGGGATFASCGDDGVVIFWDQPAPDAPLPARDISPANRARPASRTGANGGQQR